MSEMSQGQRSLLFYVLDAIRACPCKWQPVLNIVSDIDNEVFHGYVCKLQSDTTPEEAVRLSDEVRKEIL